MFSDYAMSLMWPWHCTCCLCNAQHRNKAGQPRPAQLMKLSSVQQFPFTAWQLPTHGILPAAPHDREPGFVLCSGSSCCHLLGFSQPPFTVGFTLVSERRFVMSVMVNGFDASPAQAGNLGDGL